MNAYVQFHARAKQDGRDVDDKIAAKAREALGDAKVREALGSESLAVFAALIKDRERFWKAETGAAPAAGLPEPERPFVLKVWGALAPQHSAALSLFEAGSNDGANTLPVLHAPPHRPEVEGFPQRGSDYDQILYVLRTSLTPPSQSEIASELSKYGIRLTRDQIRRRMRTLRDHGLVQHIPPGIARASGYVLTGAEVPVPELESASKPGLQAGTLPCLAYEAVLDSGRFSHSSEVRSLLKSTLPQREHRKLAQLSHVLRKLVDRTILTKVSYESGYHHHYYGLPDWLTDDGDFADPSYKPDPERLEGVNEEDITFY